MICLAESYLTVLNRSTQTFDVQVRGQKTSRRFKKEVVKLRDEDHSWPEISKLMGVKEGTVRGTWFRLIQQDKLEKYRTLINPPKLKL
jgi:DNA-directed RNA polymerase specialized sigma24 family protein